MPRAVGEKVKGKWTYLHLAVDGGGDTYGFCFCSTRNDKEAKRFLAKASNRLEEWEGSETINTDKALTYGIAIGVLK